MSEGTNIAKAYVQILPSMQGIKAQLAEQLGGAVDKPSKEAGSKAGANIAGFIKKAIAAAGIGVAIKNVVGKALTEAADLQQSIGGIETLFGAGGAKSVQEYAASVGKSVAEVQGQYDSLKASESKMLAYADAAWKTAGLSANDYMQTSTSFAASLLSSLDGDTNAAADAANKAVIAMSDNANKMGTDMQSIMNAYQGFAKGQYTMLDNLKLGYGGTKGEMERLLADAEKLTGVHYDIDNLADVYTAISAIQDKLGISGTTAKEAATTFSGSMASMKAAAANVLGNLGLGENIMPSLKALGESVKTFLLGNLMPMLRDVIRGLPELATEAISFIGTLAGELLQDLPGLVDNLKYLFYNVLNGILQALPEIGNALPGILEQVIASIGNGFGAFAEVGAKLLEALADGISTNLPVLISGFTELLPKLLAAINNNLPTLLSAGLTILQALADGILQALPSLTAMLPQITMTLIGFITENLPTIITTGVQILLALINGLVQAIPTLTQAIPQVIGAIVALVIQNLPTIIAAGLQILNALINGLITALPDLMVMVPQIIQTIRTVLMENLGTIIEGGVHILTALIDGLLSRLGTLITAGLKLVGAIVDQIKQAPAKMLAIGQNIVKGIWNGISNSFQWIKNKLSEWIGNVVAFIKKLFKIGSPSKLMAEEVGRFLPPGISVGVDANAYLVEDSFRDMAASIDAEAAFRPVWDAVPDAESLGLAGANGRLRVETDADPSRGGDPLLRIAELLEAFYEAYLAQQEDGGGDPAAFLRWLDARLGRMAALKERGV